MSRVLLSKGIEVSTKIEQLEFQAEARQLLQLMIHSIYSNKDIFLRELISNASDALDKLRLEAFRDKELEVDTSDLHIEIEVDAEQRTLTVRDNGIGMSRDEVVELIGTIAKSGTAELRRKLKEAKDAAASEELIGQFGVGFYSTLHGGRQGHAADPPGRRERGHALGVRAARAPTPSRRSTTPRRAPRSRCTSSPRTPRTSSSTTRRNGRSGRSSSGTPTSSPGRSGWPSSARFPAEGTARTRSPRRSETLNSMKALWARSKDEVTDDEYNEFYKHISHDWDDPLEIIHMKAEGTFEYQALLFIPSHAAVRPVHAGRQARCAAVRQARLHHGRLRSADAGVPALRQGRGRRAGPVAQRVAGDPAAGPPDPDDPAPAGQEGALHGQGPARPNGPDELPHVLGGVRPRRSRRG